jgi:prepilin-type processing-associated H-X9-DG protein
MIITGDALCYFLLPSGGPRWVAQTELEFLLITQPRGSYSVLYGPGYGGSLAFREDGVYQRRHNERFNIQFADGHVAAFRMDDLFTTNSDATLARWNIDNLPHRELVGNQGSP